MDVLWKNLVYSVRMLLKRPSLTAVAIMAIALGIGANTAIFSVVNSVLLQTLPYDQPQQLVMLGAEQRDQTLDGRGSFSVPDFLDIKNNPRRSNTWRRTRARAQSLPKVATRSVCSAPPLAPTTFHFFV